MATVYLALGSNVGDHEANLRRAIELIAAEGVQITKRSSFYETEPVDFLDQDWFLNAALEAHTDLEPLNLLSILRDIELRMGSKKAFAKGPRLIDLDILLYEDETIDTPDLQLPHPRMLERKFVLIPLVEMVPDLRHPSWLGTAKHMLEICPDTSEVRKFT
jgi:2-amino-4-hydroxy-6-hydroxymethyldihydropteridine diphosphokinase